LPGQCCIITRVPEAQITQVAGIPVLPNSGVSILWHNKDAATASDQDPHALVGKAGIRARLPWREHDLDHYTVVVMHTHTRISRAEDGRFGAQQSGDRAVWIIEDALHCESVTRYASSRRHERVARAGWRATGVALG
jgi:hypothetical protein